MRSFKEIIEICESQKLSFPEAVLFLQSEEEGKDKAKIFSLMEDRLEDMGRSVEEALSGTWNGMLSSDPTSLMSDYFNSNDPLSGSFIFRACQISMSVASCNSCMGRIVAAPTAGSCGIIPGLLFSWKEKERLCTCELTNALITAAGVGEVIAKRATLAGAEGGCQAECGSAAAMGSAALVYLRNGSAEAITQSAAITIKSVMGLVCDPVAGLVEIPCIKRNGTLVSLAAISADMALAGVNSMIPPDEVLDAMSKVGKSIPETLRETGLGGVAATDTGKRLAEKLGQ